MNTNRLTIFVDRKTARGGGQVVLEELLARSASTPDAVRVLGSVDSPSFLTLPDHVNIFTDPRAATSEVRGREVVVVANSTADFAWALQFAASLRGAAARVETVAIMHNYPGSIAKGLVTHGALSRFHRVIAVEPGLARLRKDAEIPPWLSIPSSVPLPLVDGQTGTVRCFARPDRPKGLHLLPRIFAELSAAGLKCEVALGGAIDGDERYERGLRKNLAPWLVNGPRDPSWLNPGDIFIIPSTAGETACLSAQEALSRGCAVVASRIGLMPYLVPTGAAIQTFALRDQRGAVDATRRLTAMPKAEFARQCGEAATSINARAGKWYDHVAESLGL